MHAGQVINNITNIIMFVKYPTISILIPTLNAANVLEGCLKSITEQEYPWDKVEIIVADGGSTDNTLGIVSKFKVQSFRPELRPRVSKSKIKTI